MLKKTIQINPDLFNIGGSKKKKKNKKKKLNPFSSALKPNDIKKQLIERVKAHHKKKKEEIQLEKKKEEEAKIFTNDFTDTVSYLNTLTKQNRKKKDRKKRVRKNKKTMKNTEQNINNSLNYASRPAPPYSNLKNSSKPTYREYNKTLKKKQNNNASPLIINTGDMPDSNTDTFDKRKSKLEDLKEKFSEVVATVEEAVEETFDDNTNKNNEVSKEHHKEKKHKRRNRYKTKRIKKKLTLGKNLKTRTVGVLINNKQTRKKIKNDHQKLHTKSTNTVKKFLLKHNLLKVGSTCPENILRVTYENSYLSGDVINKNPDILLHNYMQEV